MDRKKMSFNPFTLILDIYCGLNSCLTTCCLGATLPFHKKQNMHAHTHRHAHTHARTHTVLSV